MELIAVDVKIICTPDGGDISLENGEFLMDSGLENAVLLSLLGGNERDPGLESDRPLQWWGNIGERDPQRRYRSETQHLINSLPLTTANLRRIDEAVRRDLAWLLEAGLVTAMGSRVTIPGVNRVLVEIVLQVRDQSFRFELSYSSDGREFVLKLIRVGAT